IPQKIRIPAGIHTVFVYPERKITCTNVHNTLKLSNPKFIITLVGADMKESQAQKIRPDLDILLQHELVASYIESTTNRHTRRARVSDLLAFVQEQTSKPAEYHEVVDNLLRL